MRAVSAAFSRYVLALNELSYKKRMRKMLMKSTVGLIKNVNPIYVKAKGYLMQRSSNKELNQSNIFIYKKIIKLK
jgi:hypothetical protein